MYLQEKENVYDLMWNNRITYGDVHKKGRVGAFGTYNFENADVEHAGVRMFDLYVRKGSPCRQSDKGLVLPAYDYCLKCSHTFNMLDARGAVSVTERTHYIDRIRNLARVAARNYVAQREEMGHPLGTV